MKQIIPILLVLILIISTGAFAEGELTPVIDFKDGYITAQGTGIMPPNVKEMSQGVALARLAAKVDAQRNLLEIIAGLKLNSETSVVNLMANDVIRTQVIGVLQGAQIVPGSEYFQQGVYHLELRVTVKNLNQALTNGGSKEVSPTQTATPTAPAVTTKGENNKAATQTAPVANPETSGTTQTVNQASASATANPNPAPAASAVEPQPAQAAPKVVYTGLAIDASNFQITAPEVTEIRDAKGTLIYSANGAAQPIPVLKMKREEALADKRLGSNPFTVSALKVSKDGAVIIVSEEDGRLILTNLENTDVFLLGKYVVFYGGTK